MSLAANCTIRYAAVDSKYKSSPSTHPVQSPVGDQLPVVQRQPQVPAQNRAARHHAIASVPVLMRGLPAKDPENEMLAHV
jgi:hypothetical protein